MAVNQSSRLQLEIRPISISPEFQELELVCLTEKGMRSFDKALTRETFTASDREVLAKIEYLNLKWYHLNPAAVSKRFELLGDLKQIKALILNLSTVKLSEISRFSTLKHLSLNAAEYANCEKLLAFQRLESLTLFHWKDEDLKTVSYISGLKYLAVYGSNIMDYQEVGKLTNLKTLVIHPGIQSAIERLVPDLNPLHGLDQLEKLDLSNLVLKDLSFLTNMRQLKTLSIAIDSLSDLNGFKQLNSLQKLTLKCHSSISDFGVLGKLVNLEHLDLNVTDASNCNFLQSLKKLKILNLKSHKTAFFNLKLISSKQLTQLTLSGLVVSNTSHLRRFSHMKHLSLEVQSTSDFSPLSVLKKLETLAISGTELLYRAPLIYLEGLPLKSLRLHHMEIRDFSWLNKLSDLRNLDLRYCLVMNEPRFATRLYSLNVDKTNLIRNKAYKLQELLEARNLIWRETSDELLGKVIPSHAEVANCIEAVLEKRHKKLVEISILNIAPLTSSREMNTYNVSFEIILPKLSEEVNQTWEIGYRSGELVPLVF